MAKVLGVRCEYCHVTAPGSDIPGSYAWSSDELAAKKTARVMMRMVRRQQRRLTPPDSPDFSAQEFVEKMELGLFYGRFNEEIKKLSNEQLKAVGYIFRQRSSRPPPEKQK